MSAGVVELRAGAATLRLAPALGGRITACALVMADGQTRPVLHPYPEDQRDLDHWAKGGLYPLIPYSGRLRDARLRFAGRDWPLAPYEGSPHTLHGIAQRRPWTLREHGADRARLAYTHAPDAHWPWAFEAELAVTLAPRCQRIDLTLRNIDTQPMPGGIGLHPYVVHEARDALAFDAGAAWPFDADYLAHAQPPDLAVRTHRLTAADFAAGEVTRFHAGWRGALQLGGDDGAPRLRLRADGALTQLVIHRPAQAPYLCIEPVSHVADGFNLQAQGVADTGTRVLAPGEVLVGRLVIATGAVAD